MVISYLLDDDDVVRTLLEAQLYTLACLSTVVADFARTAAKHMSTRAASKLAQLNPSPPPVTKTCFSLPNKHSFFSLNKTGGGSSSAGKATLLTVQAKWALWHVTRGEQPPRE